MNGSIYSEYFLKPDQTTQRRYEALRAVFVEEETMQQVAQRFDLSYGTIRNGASDFCRSRDAGQGPPFLLQPIVDVRHQARVLMT